MRLDLLCFKRKLLQWFSLLSRGLGTLLRRVLLRSRVQLLQRALL